MRGFAIRSKGLRSSPLAADKTSPQQLRASAWVVPSSDAPLPIEPTETRRLEATRSSTKSSNSQYRAEAATELCDAIHKLVAQDCPTVGCGDYWKTIESQNWFAMNSWLDGPKFTVTEDLFVGELAGKNLIITGGQGLRSRSADEGHAHDVEDGWCVGDDDDYGFHDGNEDANLPILALQFDIDGTAAPHTELSPEQQAQASSNVAFIVQLGCLAYYKPPLLQSTTGRNLQLLHPTQLILAAEVDRSGQFSGYCLVSRKQRHQWLYTTQDELLIDDEAHVAPQEDVQIHPCHETRGPRKSAFAFARLKEFLSSTYSAEGKKLVAKDVFIGDMTILPVRRNEGQLECIKMQA